MKRFLLIFLLPIFIVLFIHCNDCPSTSPSFKAVAVNSLRTEFVSLYSEEPSSHLDSFRIAMFADFIFATKPTISFINTAYACDPYLPSANIGEFVDSILVYSEPNYRSKPNLTSQVYITREYNLSDFNTAIIRTINSNDLWYLKEKPSQSDSFTFGFYYYKNGVIIDSTFTQKYYISNK